MLRISLITLFGAAPQLLPRSVPPPVQFAKLTGLPAATGRCGLRSLHDGVVHRSAAIRSSSARIPTCSSSAWACRRVSTGRWCWRTPSLAARSKRPEPRATTNGPSTSAPRRCSSATSGTYRPGPSSRPTTASGTLVAGGEVLDYLGGAAAHHFGGPARRLLEAGAEEQLGPGPSTALTTSSPRPAGATADQASEWLRWRARRATRPRASPEPVPASRLWIISLTACRRSRLRWRSRPSRTNAAVSAARRLRRGPEPPRRRTRCRRGADRRAPIRPPFKCGPGAAKKLSRRPGRRARLSAGRGNDNNGARPRVLFLGNSRTRS